MEQSSLSFETRCLSSLAKVFADIVPGENPVHTGTALWKEVYAFQVAYRSSSTIRRLQVEAQSPLAPYITLRSVGLSPSELPVFENPDPGYLRTAPGLFPDPLYPQEDGFRALPGQWHAVWVTISLPSRSDVDIFTLGMETTVFPIGISFTDATGNRLGGEIFSLEVIPAELPEQKLFHTEWFHCDCLATQYGVDAFSEDHWHFVERYVRNAVDHGVNMLLTPLFTPPLDTAVGGERPTVQLVGIQLNGENDYQFDFSRLERWVSMCRGAGIRYFEFSHLFTQWGAKHAPKIIAKVEGMEKRIFGWETEAGSDQYRNFLDRFLPELVRFIREHRLEDNSYFHVSDEPTIEHLESYSQARGLLTRHLSEFKFIEALSDYDFYDRGLVPIPIPANNHIGSFLENSVDPLWTYYCCGQHRDVSNRFFSLPSARNRILGLQLYKYGIQGFLHWGYNFWYSQHSLKRIDPFRVTDADGAFPSGDAFVVYPGPKGPIDSIRWEVFREALQDLRAMELLGSLSGKDKAMELVEKGLTVELSFNTYPSGSDWLLGTRERINRAILEAVKLGPV